MKKQKILDKDTVSNTLFNLEIIENRLIEISHEIMSYQDYKVEICEPFKFDFKDERIIIVTKEFDNNGGRNFKRTYRLQYPYLYLKRWRKFLHKEIDKKI